MAKKYTLWVRDNKYYAETGDHKFWRKVIPTLAYALEEKHQYITAGWEAILTEELDYD